MARCARFTILLVVLALGSGAAIAQSHDDALRDLGELAARVDQALDIITPVGVSPLERQREAWSYLQRTGLRCAPAPTVNGSKTVLIVAGPHERPDGLDFMILSRGLVLAWNDGSRWVNLYLSQRFDARDSNPAGDLFLEGVYRVMPGGIATGVVGPGQWVDTPRPSSSPPLHQPWGAYLSALVRHIRSCRLY